MTDDEREAWEERAAVREFMGGFPRAEAERLAHEEIPRKVCHGQYSRELSAARCCRSCAQHYGCIPAREELTMAGRKA